MATKKAPKEAKNISEYLTLLNGGTINEPVKTDLVATKLKGDALIKHVEEQLKLSGDTVWVHNVSGSEYHLPPHSYKPEDQGTSTVFQLNEIKALDPIQAKDRNFKNAILAGKLEIIQEKDVEMVKRTIEQAAKAEKANTYGGEGQNKGGLHESGLPLNKKTARRYIDDTDDIDLLESWAQKEDRDYIIDYIDERIEDIENGVDTE